MRTRGDLIKQCPVKAIRLLDGAPSLAPTYWQWESGVTFNAAATYLEPSKSNRRLTELLLAGTVRGDPRLDDGMVAVHYRARPRSDPGYLITRSYVGLA